MRGSKAQMVVEQNRKIQVRGVRIPHCLSFVSPIKHLKGVEEMNSAQLLHQSKRFVKRNASTILTCIGGVGVVATTITAVKATPTAIKLLEEAKAKKGEDLTNLEKVCVAGPSYIPTLLLGASTIACIFGANALNKRQQAALVSAYALLDNSYKEYRGKLKELYGNDADRHIREEIAKDHYADQEITVDDDKRLFYDAFSERYFETTAEQVRDAEYFLNRELNSYCVVTLNEYYDKLGVPTIPGGDEIGWASGMLYEYYDRSWIDIIYHKTTLDDGLECTIIEMMNEPVAGFDEY